ncbi:MAG: hypothetical protein LBQ34_03885 [Alphaproteobacteria bacterium]|jgi:phage tail sheath protein FI|nr:hypothetical protein [Alphaproteobacteria bacterium]
MTNFLHGIEIIEVDSGGRTITTPSTSVIGIVGTAPLANAENFPLNKPILITSIQDIIALKLGDEGTLPSALYSVYNQTSAICVVVRVEEALEDSTDATRNSQLDMEQTLKNLAGDVAKYTGVYALALAETETKYKPKLLVCPYYSSIPTEDNKPNAIVAALLDMAEKLRGVAIIDGTNTTRSDAIDFASQIGNARAMIIDPAYKPSFNSTESTLSASPLMAGIFAKNDATKGFW